MKVKCVDDRDGWNHLTIGKEYDLINYGDHFKEYYCVINDADVRYCYEKKYFEIVEENTNQDITITLTKEEVNTLLILLMNVGGTMRSPRKHADSLFKKLSVDMTWDEYKQLPEKKLVEFKGYCFFFNDYPEEKSPKQLKIEELQGTIEEMKKQVEQLKKEIL